MSAKRSRPGARTPPTKLNPIPRVSHASWAPSVRPSIHPGSGGNFPACVLPPLLLFGHAIHYLPTRFTPIWRPKGCNPPSFPPKTKINSLPRFRIFIHTSIHLAIDPCHFLLLVWFWARLEILRKSMIRISILFPFIFKIRFP